MGVWRYDRPAGALRPMEVGRFGEDVASSEDQGQPGSAAQSRRLQDAILHGGVRW